MYVVISIEHHHDVPGYHTERTSGCDVLLQAEALVSERVITEDFLRPLKLQLRDLDEQVSWTSIYM